jgi:putative redox protein
MHSPVDRVVSIEHARRIFEAARHPKSFVSLDTADHLLTRARDADYVADVLSAWAARYVEGVAPAAESEPEVAAGEVQVGENGEGRFSNTVRTGRHRLLADEPSGKGGDDSGPGPHEYLLAGLGACTSMTLRMYAEHKGLPLEHVAVTLSHTQVDAADCADCEHTEGRIHRIDRRIHITGDLTAEQRRRMVEIADRCPVHRTLTGQLEIHTREAGD